MMLVSVGQSMMAVDPSVAFWRARVSSAGLVADMFVHSFLVKLTCHVEEHLCLRGYIINRLDNGSFLGLIYSSHC